MKERDRSVSATVAADNYPEPQGTIWLVDPSELFLWLQFRLL